MLAFLLLIACKDPGAEGWDVQDRAPGQRAPLTASCDDNDPTDCLLPWPSSRFLEADASTATGLRVRVDPASVHAGDDPGFLNTADGFSRITGVATGFGARLDPTGAEGALLLLVAEPGHPDYGAAFPLAVEVVEGGGSLAPEDLLIGRPRRPLPADAEMVVVVLDELQAADGSALTASTDTKLALGLQSPATEEEALLAAYHAPTRALLESAGVEVGSVLRAWDFVTRSAEDPTARLDLMRASDEAALAAGEVSVVIDEVTLAPSASIAAIVLGHLEGLPEFRDADGGFNLDAEGQLALAGGTRTAPFRVIIPAGEGDYAVALYGHGTGGSVEDDAFDHETAAAGLAKVGLRFDGWTEDDVFITFGRLASGVLSGAELSTAGLLTSVADASAVLSAMDGVLGEALAAGTLGGVDNPAAGRWPDASEPLWMGGSLGGTMGAVITLSDERVRYAVLNVPGGGWTHFIPPSSTYDMLAGVFNATYGDTGTAALAMLMSQGAWDDVDGAVWADLGDGRDMALLQESLGDPILPNIGTELLAASLGAALIEPSIEPISTLDAVDGSSDRTALEQFRVPSTESEYGIHGFAARDTPAGLAAMEQIFDFFRSALDGEPRIEHPDACRDVSEDGSCDFGEAW